MLKKRWVRITVIIAAVLVALVVALSYVIDEPLRQYIEREVNRGLKGYSVRIEHLNVHPLLLSIDLKNVLVVQEANPRPPIVDIGRIHGGVHWKELLTGHIVADAEIIDPIVYVNVKNFMAEVKKPPEKKEAWQDVIESIAPLTVNEFRIRNGEVTYLESTGTEPITVKDLMFVARNVKNVRSPERTYPSDISLEAVLFDSKITAKGSADFLLKPYPGLKISADLSDLELSHFKHIAAAHKIMLKKGTVSGAVNIEFAPDRKIFVLNDFVLTNPAVDFVSVAGPPVPEEVKKEKKAQAAAKIKEIEKKTVNEPALLVKANRIRIINGTIGMVNQAANPDYRVFMDRTDLDVRNFSNHISEGPAELHMKGMFMGSGPTTASGTFRPEKRGPDFSVQVSIRNTRMQAMNDIFRAYGKFDVKEGRFSLFSELSVKNDKVTGYVKPLFEDVKVYDKRTDEEKSEFRKLYEKIVGGVANLLENEPREAVATKTPITGKIEDPKAGTWITLVNLSRNAFFKAILPGFEENIK